jgi:nucleotide-binding universal stress UspA family protein
MFKEKRSGGYPDNSFRIYEACATIEINSEGLGRVLLFFQTGTRMGGGVVSRVLVAVDGSPYSLRAALLGAKILSRDSPGTLTLIYVAKAAGDLDWFRFQGPLRDFNQAAAEERAALKKTFKEGQEVLKEARTACSEQLKHFPVRVETVVDQGDPAEQLINFVEKRPYDLIILGCRGRGRLQGVIIGSVSQKVLHNTQCPVLIVK